MKRSTYTIRAERSGNWWSISVSEVPGAFSQARNLRDVEEMGREAISEILGCRPNAFDVTREVVASPGLQRKIQQAKTARMKSDASSERASLKSREAAVALRDAGLTQREVGELLGVSHQRASQLLHSS